MIKVQQGTVILSEQTLRELLKAVERRKETFITDAPMPDYSDVDVDLSTIEEEDYDRGNIYVVSKHSRTSFKIKIENPSSPDERSEGLGYKLYTPLGRIKTK